jgi:hypothetical protein
MTCSRAGRAALKNPAYAAPAASWRKQTNRQPLLAESDTGISQACASNCLTPLEKILESAAPALINCLNFLVGSQQ